ncbi:MAG TPA: hypothetical protein VFB29_04790 [Pseudolabrys sp.]|nr:hypothetical protein [Pseudolabrys sp.]
MVRVVNTPAKVNLPRYQPTTLGFEDAVQQAKDILYQADRASLRLGEIADRVEPRYGDETLKKLANTIGVSPRTLERHRDVFRAWKEIPAPERELVTYSIAKELETHPDRFKIIKGNPNLTKVEAHQLMREYRQRNEGKTTAQAGDDEREAKVKWQSDLPLRLDKVLGDLDLDGHWLLDDPPDADLVDRADRVVEAALKLRGYLKWAHEATPEELEEARQGHVNKQSREQQTDDRLEIPDFLRRAA